MIISQAAVLKGVGLWFSQAVTQADATGYPLVEKLLKEGLTFGRGGGYEVVDKVHLTSSRGI